MQSPPGRDLHRAALDQHQYAATFGTHAAVAGGRDEGERQRHEHQPACIGGRCNAFCMNNVITR